MKTNTPEYSSYIHKSRYARWIESENRRETWTETVDRYINYFGDKFDTPKTRETVRNAILNLEVLPSMRALMCAGVAAEHSEIALYNCAFIACDDPFMFSEVMYILMNGTGVGFSVERQHIAKLPSLPKTFKGFNKTIVVEDSKEGWAGSYNELLRQLYLGYIPKWDVSKVRAKGERLKIFGGRASGAEPLVDLFKFTTNVFKNASGDKLKSIECHDLLCKIANVVVCGGVRRSALISLSNLSDHRMAKAKSGEWWIDNPQRALANNSVNYTEKPEIGDFMTEFKNLYESKSGERGIFSSHVAKLTIPERRKELGYQGSMGCNPCARGDMRLLTDKGYIEIEKLSDTTFNIVNKDGIVSETTAWCNGEKDVVSINFECKNKKPIIMTPDHVWMLEDGSHCQTKDLKGKRLKSYERFGDSIVQSVEPAGRALVYDFHEPVVHWGVIEGFVAHNCSEIILRDSGQFCNLSEVVIRPEDTYGTISEKVRIATIIGTIQSTKTDFKYIRKQWAENCNQERLLGVSMTGVCDHVVLRNMPDDDSYQLQNWLMDFKQVAIDTNKAYAKKLGINQASAITCIKPSGTVSQLVDAASGVHPRYAQYYIRTVRSDIKDPLATMLIAQGIPNEPCVMNPHDVVIFSFPIKTGDNSVLRDDKTALEQLDMWMVYQKNWCEHKVSITVYVKEHEWIEVMAWVWKNFDEVSGISFLPHSDHTYAQAPYQEIDEAEYLKLKSELPSIDWSKLPEFEKYDTTEPQAELACSGGACEIK